MPHFRLRLQELLNTSFPKKADDRFLVIDMERYHIRASLKDLGKKWFAFSKMDIEVDRMLQILNKH